MAETVRFELTKGFPLLVFKTSAIDHSATLPTRERILPDKEAKDVPPWFNQDLPGEFADKFFEHNTFEYSQVYATQVKGLFFTIS